jgi:crossover junction endodeoxyribonuclease RuvC
VYALQRDRARRTGTRRETGEVEMIQRVVGIDPGLAGGLGVYHSSGTPQLFPTPVTTVRRGNARRREYDVRAMHALILNCLSNTVCRVTFALELQGARPGQGVVSMFRTGFGFGLWYGLIAGASMPVQLVAPGSWKRHHGLLRCDKRASRLKAQELFPELGVLTPRDEGAAEALLLAVYVARTTKEDR